MKIEIVGNPYSLYSCPRNAPLGWCWYFLDGKPQNAEGRQDGLIYSSGHRTKEAAVAHGISKGLLEF